MTKPKMITGQKLAVLWASLIDWYFDESKPSWTADIKDEDQVMRIAFIVTSLLEELSLSIGQQTFNEKINKALE